MQFLTVSTFLAVAESALCFIGLGCVILRKQQSDYKYLCMFLTLRGLSDAILLPLLVFGGYGIEVHLAYKLYFGVYWAGFAIESVLSLLLIYSIYRLAMAPLDGLRRLGTLVFRWAASISVAIALGSTLSPHLPQSSFLTTFVTELQRTQSTLTLCLLLFVCFAIRPMGLTFSSRIFGVSLGLGLLAAMNIIVSAWIAQFKTMFTVVNTITGCITCTILLVWIAYFGLPEPKRRIIVLPTTSPFLRWNQISLVLGDDPGFVAVGGIPPELFAPAELEIMRRASLKMTDESAVIL